MVLILGYNDGSTSMGLLKPKILRGNHMRCVKVVIKPR